VLNVSGERGAAPVEAVFGIIMLLALVLGTIEVAFALYARNVVAASAHEAARTAVELGRSPDEVQLVAQRTIERAAGGLIDDFTIRTEYDESNARSVRIVVSGYLEPFGPVPIPLTFRTTASAALPDETL
jgi:hypothetical protein